MTPVQLAAELEMSPTSLRGWLRRDFPREEFKKNAPWELTPEMVRAARARFGGKRSGPSVMRHSPRMPSRLVLRQYADRTGGGLHRPFLGLAKEAGIELGQGVQVAGLTTRVHLFDLRSFGVPPEAVEGLR